VPFVKCRGIKVFYEVHGDGPPVILGHSFLCSGEMWAHQLQPLGHRHQVINVDYRGHGRSSHVSEPFTIYDLVDDCVAILDHLGIDSAVWAGLSIGGMVALRAALAAPARVSALILIDTHAGEERPYKKLKYRFLGLGARCLGIRPFLPAIVPLMFGKTTRQIRPQLVAEWKSRFAALHVPSVLHGLGALNRRDTINHRLKEIQLPSLVIVGEEDTSLPPADSLSIADGLINSSLVTIANSGHLSVLEQPEAVTTAILAFLDGLDRPTK